MHHAEQPFPLASEGRASADGDDADEGASSNGGELGGHRRGAAAGRVGDFGAEGVGVGSCMPSV